MKITIILSIILIMSFLLYKQVKYTCNIIPAPVPGTQDLPPGWYLKSGKSLLACGDLYGEQVEERS